MKKIFTLAISLLCIQALQCSDASLSSIKGLEETLWSTNDTFSIPQVEQALTSENKPTFI